MLDFNAKDIVHRIAVKFVHAFLPNAKKKYILRTVHQPELDIKGIVSKAADYNIAASPKVLEEGLTAGMELMCYLAADGYRIKTPLFNLGIRVPGEYNGTETNLPDGIYPVALLQTSASFRKYLKEKIKVDFDGIDDSHGIIAEARDEATGLVDEVMTMYNILTINGTGIKIEGDETHRDIVGVFFKPQTGLPIKARVIAVNNHKTLKVLVPHGLVAGTEYEITVKTMSSAKGNGALLKKLRNVRSDFTLVAA